MPVAPVEGVHREEGGDDAQFLERQHLIRPGRMGVNCYGPAVGLAVFPFRGPDRADELIDRRIAA